MGLWDSLGSAANTATGGLAGAGYGVVKSAFGTPDAVQPVGVDKANYQYGSSGYTADDYRKRLAAQEAAAQNRGAPVTDYGMANSDYANQQQARAGLVGLASQYQGIINGPAGPSVAEAQLRQGQDRLAHESASIAASARGGPLGTAMAVRDAQRQTALGGQAMNQQLATLRAQEDAAYRDRQLAALGGLQGLYGGVRQGDLAARAGSQSQGQFLTDEELKQRALNDAASQGYLQGQLGVNRDALGASVGYGGAVQSADQSAQNATLAANEAARQRQAALIGQVIGAGAAAASPAGRGK